MRQHNKLSARFVTTAKAGMHSDGGGLYLRVDGDGRRNWVFRFARHGKQRDMGLGSARDLPLADARQQATEARRLLSLGQDPLAAKQASRIRQQTFGEAAEAYLTAKEPEWKNPKHARQWRQTLTDYCRSIWHVNVGQVSTEHVLNVLNQAVETKLAGGQVRKGKFWTEKPDTANRLRARMEHLIDAAAAGGVITDPAWRNPCRWRFHLDKLTSKPKKLSRGHHRAAGYADIPGIMAELGTRPANAALGLRLLILTACRSGEAQYASADEFDLANKVWSIPGPRTKTGKPHRIPLSEEAVAIVESAKQLNGRYLFPGNKQDEPLSTMGFTMLLRRMFPEPAKPPTPHGFRTSFRTWASDVANAPYEVAEAALGHLVGDATERAYDRTDASSGAVASWRHGASMRAQRRQRT